jgi:CspA family cold shock protein
MSIELKKTQGIVKWFDSRGGFGFITILKGQENEGKDIFVHYSNLITHHSQYKFLVLGEYVEFELAKEARGFAQQELAELKEIAKEIHRVINDLESKK